MSAPSRVYALSRSAAAEWLASIDTHRARRALESDLDFVADLHALEFPTTYATAHGLVHDPDLLTFVARFMNDDVLGRVQKLKPIADDLGISMAQLAVAWVLGNDNVAGAIIGASRPEQVVENVKASGVVLDAGVRAAIDEALGDVVQADPGMTARNAPASRPV